MIKSAIIVCLFVIGSTVAQGIAPKVVNGTDANINEFPFMVSLRRNGGHSCGGTLLTDLWVLTAAHCLVGCILNFYFMTHNKNSLLWLKTSPAENYTVQYANTVISRNGTNVAQVAEVIAHEGYLPSNQYINDIGLVRLSEPIIDALDNFRAKLPVSGSYFETGTPAVLSGWGLNATMGVIMTNLQKVDLEIFSAYDCAQLHSSTVHYTNICGGIPEGGKGQCSGDSGGPLLVNGVQVGIVSWSVKPCTVAPYPGELPVIIRRI